VSATIAGRDPTTDVALLRAETADLAPIALDSAAPSVGALAVAVGGGREGESVAALGMVAVSDPAWRSMRGEEIDARVELDLSLRRHAEGGVALDAAGRALVMAVFGPRRRVLVIRSGTIARFAAQLEAHGKVARGYLGLGLQPVRLDREGGVSVMVMSVDAKGPGAKAGLRQGDIIQTWNGKPIASFNTLLRELGLASVGKTVAPSLRRGGEAIAVDLVIGERPEA